MYTVNVRAGLEAGKKEEKKRAASHTTHTSLNAICVSLGHTASHSHLFPLPVL